MGAGMGGKVRRDPPSVTPYDFMVVARMLFYVSTPAIPSRAAMYDNG
jgi:hypothetical protein